MINDGCSDLNVKFQLHPNLFITLFAGIQTNFCVSYPIHVIMSVECIDIYPVTKIVQLETNIDQCYILNRVVTNRVSKRSRCYLLNFNIYEQAEFQSQLNYS